jgi:hypothetical protein
MTVTPGQGLHIDLASGGDYKKVYRPSKRKLALVKGALGLTTGSATLPFVLIRTGPLTSQPGHANYAGLLGSALLMISCLLIIVLRERVILTTDYVESRLFFTSRLHVSDIKGWRSRLPNGSGDVRIYGKDARSNVVVIPSEIAADLFLHRWVRQFQQLRP